MGESRMRAVRKWMLGLPIFAGLVFACASIPFIAPAIIGCHVVPPTNFLADEVREATGYTASWGPFLGLYIIPGYSVIVYSTAALARAYLHVRKIDQKAKRWKFARQARGSVNMSTVGKQTISASFGLQTSNTNSPRRKTSRGRNLKSNLKSLKREVFWQSFFYLFALYLSWFTYLAIAVDLEEYFGGYYKLWTVLGFLLPIQGEFLGACCVDLRRPTFESFLRSLNRQ